jgi:hypothetical protein
MQAKTGGTFASPFVPPGTHVFPDLAADGENSPCQKEDSDEKEARVDLDLR